MNTGYPHNIVPERELTPAASKSYVPLTDEEYREVVALDPGQRRQWLFDRKGILAMFHEGQWLREIAERQSATP